MGLRMYCVGEDLKTTDILIHCWQKVNWYNLTRGNISKIYQNVFKMHMPFCLAILLPEIYPTDSFAHMSNDLWTKSFTEALFALEKGGRKPKCPTCYMLHKVWYTYNAAKNERENSQVLKWNTTIKWILLSRKCKVKNTLRCKKNRERKGTTNWHKMSSERYIRNRLNLLPMKGRSGRLENRGQEENV